MELTFDPQNTVQCVDILLELDNIVEGPEQFDVELSTTAPAVTLVRDTGEVTIVDSTSKSAVRSGRCN